jgi:hypothetical protein
MHPSLYTSLTSIFVESAAIYTICGALYLPFVEVDSALVDPFALLVRVLSFMGPALIQLRIAEGTAYTGGGVGSIAATMARARTLEDGEDNGIMFATRSAITRADISEDDLWRAKSSETDDRGGRVALPVGVLAHK